jgi:hypothetical protein
MRNPLGNAGRNKVLPGVRGLDDVIPGGLSPNLVGKMMCPNSIRKMERNKRGQGLVEFALVVPMLLVLVIGIAEFGRAWMTRNIMTGAAREAVRMYAVKNDTAAAGARAGSVLSSAGLDLTKATITPGNSGDAVSYIILYDFPVVVAGLIPGLSSSSIQLRSETTMRREWE